MTTPVRDEPPVPPEELVLGSGTRRPLPRWVPLLALALGIVLLAGGAVWRFWPRPPAPLTLSELQDTYAGMVRSDGTNDASVLTRQSVVENPVRVRPAACAPLVEFTSANRFPDSARDGVGTYWVGGPSTIALSTLRFDDAAAAQAELGRIGTALDDCVEQQVFVRQRDSSDVQAWSATVARSAAGDGSDGQLGYTLIGPSGVMAVQLLPYLNTVTWQYRYEGRSGADATYSPLAADQLMQGLRSQLDAVVAARPR